MTGRRTCGSLALTVVAVLALGATGCTGSGSSAGQVRGTEGKSKLYVALGGDDVYGVGPARLVDAWPQIVFRTSFPVSGTFVNLAVPRQGASGMERDQVGVAVRLRPDLVTLTLLDDLEQGRAPLEVQQRLVGILNRLHQVRGLRILVGTAPPGTALPAAVDAFNAAVKDATRVGGGELVDLSRARATDVRRRAQQIADAFGPAIRSGRPSR